MTRKTGIQSIDEDNAKLDQLVKRSDEAKGLVGKLFYLPHADGSAYYTVEAEKGQKVQIKNHAILDAWQDTVLGAGGWFPRKQIEPIIRRLEASVKMFENAAKKQKTESQKYADIVGAAALHDLGDAADVFDLASWAWKRSFRGSVKDARILKEGARAPWANDIAAALIDSGSFKAIQALKDTIVFIMLADKVQDPIVYANAAPSNAVVLAKVREAFRMAVGTDPVALKVTRSESKYLDNTSLTILGHAMEMGLGLGWNKIGSVTYDPQDGKILQVDIAFQVDDKNKVTQ